MLYLKNPRRFVKHLVILPIISSLIIPLIIMDVWIEIYHRICFPLYGVPCAKRRDYIQIIDRFKLPYLNFWQKIYCAYCGYGNGVIRYWAKIAAETELYWCGIRHENRKNFIMPEHHEKFVKYGDEKEFKKRYLDK